MSRILLLAVLLLAGCLPSTPDVAVDTCILRQYLEECENENLIPEEQQACKAKAPAEATRVLGGIRSECRG